MDGNIYLAISLRNVGSGIAVMFGWSFMPELAYSDVPHADPDDFRMQSRDLYIAAGDIGFWQAAIREHGRSRTTPALSKDIREMQPFTIELLYGDHEGGQRTITRFGMVPRIGDGGDEVVSRHVARHWNLDRPDPR